MLQLLAAKLDAALNAAITELNLLHLSSRQVSLSGLNIGQGFVIMSMLRLHVESVVKVASAHA